MMAGEPDKKVWISRSEAVAVYVLTLVFVCCVTVIAVRQRRAGRGVEIIRASGEDLSYRVDVNRAGPAELMLLPGIGKVRAQRMVSWREKNGPFRSLDDVAKAAGLSHKAMERIRDMITLGRAGDRSAISGGDG